MTSGKKGTGSAMAWFIFALSLAAFGVEAWQSEMYRADKRAQTLRLAELVKQGESTHQALCDSAEQYWKENPDVAENDFFGRERIAGCAGAYEHWTRHGRQEGRKWRE